jgi:hypothetical protein
MIDELADFSSLVVHHDVSGSSRHLYLPSSLEAIVNDVLLIRFCI